MNTKQIKYALALSQTLNFSQVAEGFGITQPALSKQIQHLENELGVKLFDRSSAPMTVTPAGEHFFRNARELIYKEEQLKKAMLQFKSGENGRLTIGVTPFRSLYLMPNLINKIREEFPGVQVTLRELPIEPLRKEAAEGKLDFAILNLPVDSTLMDITPLEPDTLVLAVHKSLADALPNPKNGAFDFKVFENLPFVVLSHGQELRQLFDGLSASSDFTPNIAAEVMGVISAWGMARAGVGAALLPLQFASNQQLDSNLSLYVIKDSLYSRQPVVVTRKGQVKSPYTEYAIKLLTDK